MLFGALVAATIFHPVVVAWFAVAFALALVLQLTVDFSRWWRGKWPYNRPSTLEEDADA